MLLRNMNQNFPRILYQIFHQSIVYIYMFLRVLFVYLLQSSFHSYTLITDDINLTVLIANKLKIPLSSPLTILLFSIPLTHSSEPILILKTLIVLYLVSSEQYNLNWILI